jgi:hypothetical protein
MQFARLPAITFFDGVVIVVIVVIVTVTKDLVGVRHYLAKNMNVSVARKLNKGIQ